MGSEMLSQFSGVAEQFRDPQATITQKAQKEKTSGAKRRRDEGMRETEIKKTARPSARGSSFFSKPTNSDLLMFRILNICFYTHFPFKIIYHIPGKLQSITPRGRDMVFHCNLLLIFKQELLHKNPFNVTVRPIKSRGFLLMTQAIVKDSRLNVLRMWYSVPREF